MPTPRTLLALPVSLAFLCLSAAASQAGPAPDTNALVRLLVTQGKAPAAALLAHDSTGVGTAPTGTDHPRAGTDDARAGSDYALGTTEYTQAGTGIGP